ncbi:MAG TPA: hypothetical protein VIH18_05055 [Candidatus Binatia bacterium]|jgi:hypothetical protein
MKPYVRITALVLGALFLVAAATAGVELWSEGDLLVNPKLKPAAAWLLSGAMFLAVGLRGLWRRQKKPFEHR